MPCVVADTSPLFYLARLGRLTLLQDLYGKVSLPPIVWREVLNGGVNYPDILQPLKSARQSEWLLVSETPHPLQLIETARLDEGEREAIALAREIKADLLIVDELLARGVAKRLGLAVTGTLGVLAAAKNKGLISSLRDELTMLRQKTTFRFSTHLENEILSVAGESQNP